MTPSKDFSLYKVFESSEDRSVNFLFQNPDAAIIESRFVQRDDTKIIIYLSSQTGCEQACRFCHLTQLGLNRQVRSVDLYTFQLQAMTVLRHMLASKGIQGKPSRVSFNFMARGEPLLNPTLVQTPTLVYDALTDIAHLASFSEVDFKISTILPQSPPGNDGSRIIPYYEMLQNVVFKQTHAVELYYSFYSVDPVFRKQWLPNSIAADVAGVVLAETHDRLVLHHALIAGANDRSEDMAVICHWLRKYDIRARFNLVRYNPFSPNQGQETDDATIENYLDQLRQSDCFTSVQIVPRVGFDVAASCGMFINNSQV